MPQEALGLTDRFRVLALVWITFALFVRVRHFEFLNWDDNVFVLENPWLLLPFGDALKTFFSTPFFNDYLPLTLTSLWVDQWLGAGGPETFHVTNLLLHLLNVVLLWRVLREFFEDQRIVWVILVVFALHPLQIESVAWISERKGLLTATFTLLATLLALRENFISYTLLFAAAMLSKTSSIGLPLLLATLEFARGERSRMLRHHGFALAVGLAIMIYRVHAYAYLQPNFAAATLSFDHVLQIPLFVLNALGFYITKFVYPLELSVIYPAFALTPMVAARIAVVVGLMGVTWRYFKLTRDGRPALCLLFMVLLLLPVLQLVPRLNYVNDRYCYLAIIPLTAWLGLVIRSRLLAPVLGALCFVLAWPQVDVWRNSQTLWQSVAARQPWSGTAHLNLGLALERGGRVPDALEQYHLAAAADVMEDSRAQALSNLASLHSTLSLPHYYNLALARNLMEQALAAPSNEIHRYWLRYNAARLQAMAGDALGAKQACQALLVDLEKLSDTRLDPARKFTADLLASLNQ